MALGRAILHRPSECAQRRAVVRDRDPAGEEQAADMDEDDDRLR